MPKRPLQELLDACGNIVSLLGNSQFSAYIYPVVPTEFSNWRTERQPYRSSTSGSE